jgi:hypothetical protein
VYNGKIYLFQCSKYANHSYNYQGINNVWENLKHVREYVTGVYLVVPSRRVYDEVEWQKFTVKAEGAASGVAQSKAVEKATAKWPERLCQWKMLSMIETGHVSFTADESTEPEI